MSCKFVVSVAAILLMASWSSWAADWGRPFTRRSVQVTTGLTVKANLP